MNIFDKLKLPFAKKVKQVPVSWVEEGPEHYYVIHHLLFGYSDSTSVPNGYADIFSDAEVHCTLSGVGWATNAERKNYRCSLKIGETYRCRSACSRAGSKISVPAI